jgi:hypothetical protein
MGIERSVLIFCLYQQSVCVQTEEQHEARYAKAPDHGACLVPAHQRGNGKQTAGGCAHANSQQEKPDKRARGYIILKKDAANAQ